MNIMNQLGRCHFMRIYELPVEIISQKQKKTYFENVCGSLGEVKYCSWGEKIPKRRGRVRFARKCKKKNEFPFVRGKEEKIRKRGGTGNQMVLTQMSRQMSKIVEFFNAPKGISIQIDRKWCVLAWWQTSRANHNILSGFDNANFRNLHLYVILSGQSSIQGIINLD